MSPKMRALLIPEVGEAAVAAFRSTAYTSELADWADVLVGFQRSHLAKLETDAPAKACAAIGRWLPGDRPWLKDPHFDSTGQLHMAAVTALKIAIPSMQLEVLG